jgi:hypothetical protein
MKINLLQICASFMLFDLGTVGLHFLILNGMLPFPSGREVSCPVFDV